MSLPGMVQIKVVCCWLHISINIMYSNSMAHHITIRIKLETGFEFSTDETNLKIKIRCKPPRTPPNTLLKKVSFIQM